MIERLKQLTGMGCVPLCSLPHALGTVNINNNWWLLQGNFPSIKQVDFEIDRGEIDRGATSTCLMIDPSKMWSDGEADSKLVTY